MKSLFYQILAALVALQICSAKAPEESFRTLVATTTADRSGKAWAYLQWQAQDLDLLNGRAYAIFSKDGDAASASAYSLATTMQMQTNPTVLDAIVATSDRVGSSEEALEATVDELFEQLIPSDSLSLGEKLSVVMFSARKSPEVFESLVFLAKLHPIIGVCMGTSALVEADSSAMTTYEVRAPRLPGNTELETYDIVVGRVTVDPKNLVVLPEPGAPVAVPDLSPTGNLNVHLRWGTPDTIKRLAMFHYGYNVYRVAKAHAQSKGWHFSRPGVGLLAIDAVFAPGEVVRTNALPILPREIMTVIEAAKFSEPDPKDEVYFEIDDNNRFEEGGVPFVDGSQYYYYVVPRDLLGRDGESSTGALVTVCATMPPLPPSKVSVTNHYSYDTTSGKSDQRLKVEWSASPESETNPSGYVLYRWNNRRLLQRFGSADPATSLAKISDVIPHVDGQERYSYIDDGPGAPAVPADVGKTYWYTVRAVYDSACGRLFSGNSAPKWGVLRDRRGPDIGDGRPGRPGLTVTCKRVRITKDISFFADDNAPRGEIPIRFKISRDEKTQQPDALSIGVRWFDKDKQGNPIKPANIRTMGTHKLKGTGQTVIEELFPYALLARDCTDICMSVPGSDPIYCPTRDLLQQINERDNADGACISLRVDVQIFTKEVDTPTGGVHETEGAGGETNPIDVTMVLPRDAKEWKLYKKVDGAAMTMVEQGTGEAGELTIQDYKMPANSSEVCYFSQYFDTHGNPSALEPLGCVRTSSKVAMPVPMLNVPEAEGGVEGRTKLSWFCDVEGVERFKVCIADGLTEASRGIYSNELTLEGLALGDEVFTCYTTGRLGGNFGDGGAFHELELNLLAGREYKFYIVSLSAAGDESAPSNIIDFIWREPVADDLAEVPWPARPLPIVDANFIPKVRAEYIFDAEQEYFGAAVRIGELTGFNDQTVDYGTLQPESPATQIVFSPTVVSVSGVKSASIEDYLYTSATGETVLSSVLYRRQIPTETYPTVSDTTVQVSPLIDRIRDKYSSVDQELTVYDPFILIHQTDRDLNNKTVGIYLKDTHGVIAGAAYTYFLVRFSDNKEIDRVLPAGNVTLVPEPTTP